MVIAKNVYTAWLIIYVAQYITIVFISSLYEMTAKRTMCQHCSSTICLSDVVTKKNDVSLLLKKQQMYFMYCQSEKITIWLYTFNPQIQWRNIEVCIFSSGNKSRLNPCTLVHTLVAMLQNQSSIDVHFFHSRSQITFFGCTQMHYSIL